MPIHKGGGKDRADPASYRGIYLSSALAKLFEGILICRLTKFTESHCTLSQNQLVTRPGLQIHDTIYSLLSTNESRVFSLPLSHCICTQTEQMVNTESTAARTSATVDDLYWTAKLLLVRCAIQSVSEHQPSSFILATCACSHAAGKSKMLRVTSTRFEKQVQATSLYRAQREIEGREKKRERGETLL